MMEELNKEPELVSIEGLQFKPYQMDCMRDLAQMNKYGNVNEWLRDAILLNILIPKLEVIYENYGEPLLEKLKQDGYSR